MNKKTIKISEIGEITLQKSKRASRMTIRLKPFKGVQVSLPYRVSFEEAEKFVLQKKDWILDNLPKIQNYEQKKTIFDENTVFHTKFHQLEIIRQSRIKPLAQLINGKIQVLLPLDTDIKKDTIQKFIVSAIEFALRHESETYLPQRLAELAQKYQFQYQKVTIRNTKTRWGSCSQENNISLSTQLMRLPDELIDYVLLHELCHTIEKNHKKPFWDLLQSVSGNARGLDNEMKKYPAKVF